MDEEELANIKIYGFWGWTKWSFRSPKNFGKIANWNNKCFDIARAVIVKGKGLIV